MFAYTHKKESIYQTHFTYCFYKIFASKISVNKKMKLQSLTFIQHKKYLNSMLTSLTIQQLNLFLSTKVIFKLLNRTGDPTRLFRNQYKRDMPEIRRNPRLDVPPTLKKKKILHRNRRKNRPLSIFSISKKFGYMR